MLIEEISPCGNCKFRMRIPGDAHIRCGNPPSIEKYLPNGSYKDAKIILTAESVVVSAWPGSGIFPMYFDMQTVFACSNKDLEPAPVINP